MGFDTAAPIGKAETKAFKVFMKKYLKKHLNQDQDKCTWKGTNAWGKLTAAQKKLFYNRRVSWPKRVTQKKRVPIPKRKWQAKPKPKAKIVGRPAASRVKKVSKKVFKKLSTRLKPIRR